MIYFYAISTSRTPTLLTIESCSEVNRFVCPNSRRVFKIVKEVRRDNPAEAFTEWDVSGYKIDF